MGSYDAVVKYLSKEDLAETAKKALTERAALHAQVAALVAALQQYADPMSWGYRDESGCPKGYGKYEDACFIGRDVAVAAIAAAEGSAE